MLRVLLLLETHCKFNNPLLASVKSMLAHRLEVPDTQPSVDPENRKSPACARRVAAERKLILCTHAPACIKFTLPAQLTGKGGIGGLGPIVYKLLLQVQSALIEGPVLHYSRIHMPIRAPKAGAAKRYE